MEYINSKNVNEDSEFPYLVLHRKNETSLPRTPGFRAYHWHEDMQFVYVIMGKVCVRTLEKTETLSAGEGVFINKNVVHREDGAGECEYKCFIFPERLVTFYPGSPVMRMTQRITENHGMPLIRLSRERDWCKEALNILEKLVRIEQNKTEFYCCDVLTELSLLWCILLKNLKILSAVPETNEAVRIRKILGFIEAHYAEDLSLEMLSQSAGISNSEAIRCFKKVMQTTPYRYLMDVRLEKAEHLLRETALPVSEIALRTGFNQQAYFGKCFREKMDCTPREYRRKSVKQAVPHSIDGKMRAQKA